jgi:hypothetical protein
MTDRRQQRINKLMKSAPTEEEQKMIKQMEKLSI